MNPKKGVYGGVSHPHTPLFSIISPSAEQLQNSINEKPELVAPAFHNKKRAVRALRSQQQSSQPQLLLRYFIKRQNKG